MRDTNIILLLIAWTMCKKVQSCRMWILLLVTWNWAYFRPLEIPCNSLPLCCLECFLIPHCFSGAGILIKNTVSRPFQSSKVHPKYEIFLEYSTLFSNRRHFQKNKTLWCNVQKGVIMYKIAYFIYWIYLANGVFKKYVFFKK